MPAQRDAAAKSFVDTVWLVSGVGDFNGDGRDDVLWRNEDNGIVSAWVGREDGGYLINDAASLSAPVSDA